MRQRDGRPPYHVGGRLWRPPLRESRISASSAAPACKATFLRRGTIANAICPGVEPEGAPYSPGGCKAGGRSPPLRAHAMCHRIVGITYSAPALTPVGQRLA